MSATDPFGLVGQVLDGQFRIDKLVGEGGFSAVYRGHHQGLDEPIAIKCLKLPASLGTSLVETFVRRFRDESRILYRLSQGNLHVVRSIAAGTTQAPATGALVPYMVLEWLEGRSLQNDFTVRRTVGEKGRALSDVMKIFATAADGLSHAHAQGVVHRDLNPGNLFLAQTPQGVKMKVLDFGVAKLMHDGALDLGPRSHTIGAIRIFAPAYGAPEQFDDGIGPVGAWSDVYSFALILLEALRDRSVNEGTHLGEFATAAVDPNRRPTPRSLGVDVPDEVEAAFARATTLTPKDRWQSAGDFWQALSIAVKVASEHKHEQAARETPPVGVAGPQNLAADPKKTNPLNRTMPLGASTQLPAGLPRPGQKPGSRTPTTIGVPAPAAGAAPRPAAGAPAPVGAAPRPAAGARPPTSDRKPGTPGSRPGGAPATERFSSPDMPRPGSTPALDEALGDSDAPPRRSSSIPTSEGPSPVTAVNADGVPILGDEEEDEATKVHAPAPEMLRTLALQDAAAARAAALAKAKAAETAKTAPPIGDPSADDSLAIAAQSTTAPPPRNEGASRTSPIPPAPDSGGTLMMAPVPGRPPPQAPYAGPQQPIHAPPAPQPHPPPPQAKGALGSTLAMASPYAQQQQQQQHAPPMQPSQSQVQFGNAATIAMAAHPVVPQHQHPPPRDSQLLAMPGPGVPGQPMAGPQGAGETSSMTTWSPLVPPPPHQAGPGGHAQQQQQQLQPQGGFAQQASPQHQQPFSEAFPPPSYAQPSPDAGDAKKPPIVPIAIGLGVLLLVGLVLGGIAIFGGKKPVDPTLASASAVASADESAAPTPVPVPVPVPTVVETAPAVATAEPDASVATTEDASTTAADASTAAATPSATATTTATTTAPTATTAPPFGVPTTPTATAMPVPVPSAKPAIDPMAWNETAARARLALANGVLAFCKKEGGVTGPGVATVTFVPDGSVSGVTLDPPYAGTKEGDCVAGQFRRAKVTPFNGGPQTVRHGFEVPK